MQVEKLKQFGESRTHRMGLHRATLNDKSLEVYSLERKVDEENPDAIPEIRYYLYGSFAMVALSWSRHWMDPFTLAAPSSCTGFTAEQLQEHMQKLE